MSTRKSVPLLLLVLVIICCVTEYFAIHYILNLTFTKSTVYNTSDRTVFTRRLPPGFNFVHQNRKSDDIRYFRREIEGLISTSTDELGLAIEIRKWGRRQQVNFGFGGNSDNPLKLLKEQREGKAGACRRFGIILTTALVSAGFDARLVGAAPDFSDHSFNHTFVEVWIEKLDKWILIDSTYDCFYLVDGRLASLFEMYEVVKKGEFGRISFQRDGSSYFPIPEVFIEDGELSPLILSFKHIYIALSNAFADGYGVRLFGKKSIDFIHYYDEETPGHPDGLKKNVMGFIVVNFLLLSALSVFLLLSFLRRRGTG